MKGTFIVFLMMMAGLTSFAQVKIGNSPNVIDSASMLELESTSSGFLTVRMTTAQRDAITSPPNGLQVFNITTNTLDIYTDSTWKPLGYTNTEGNVVRVSSMDDLPAPSAGEILLDATKVYYFSGIIDISPNYINLNGAGLKGNDATKDGVMSTVSGAVLRSTDQTILIDHLAVIPASGSTQAYDFSDATGTKFCFLFIGNTVLEIGIPSLGVGQISGFSAIYISKNYWRCTNGIKITGDVGLLAASENYISALSNGIGFEFLSGLTIGDIDMSNNYFLYNGSTGVQLSAGATVEYGRLTSNMFRGVTNKIVGFDSYSPGWDVQMNTDIPNSRSFGYMYMVDNTTATSTSPNNTYVKIAGITTPTTLQKFASPANNRLTYTGKRPITAKIFISVGGKAPSNGSDFTFALAKNGTVITAPRQSTGTLVNNQGFSLSLETEVDMDTMTI